MHSSPVRTQRLIIESSFSHPRGGKTRTDSIHVDCYTDRMNHDTVGVRSTNIQSCSVDPRLLPASIYTDFLQYPVSPDDTNAVTHADGPTTRNRRNVRRSTPCRQLQSIKWRVAWEKTTISSFGFDIAHSMEERRCWARYASRPKPHTRYNTKMPFDFRCRRS